MAVMERYYTCWGGTDIPCELTVRKTLDFGDPSMAYFGFTLKIALREELKKFAKRYKEYSHYK
jgi:hypothetical protein